MIKAIVFVVIGIFVAPIVATWFNEFVVITSTLNNIIAGM